MFSKSFVFAILFFLSCVSAKTVVMLGDDNVQNLYSLNGNLFDTFDIVTNMGLSGQTIQGVTNTLTTFPLAPDIVTIMVGSQNLRTAFQSGSLNIDQMIEDYRLLLEKLEQSVPSTTKILLFGVLPFDSTLYNDGFRWYVLNTIVQFNTRLQDMVWSRESEHTYLITNPYDYMLTSDNRINRSLFRLVFNQYYLLNYEGYNVWKQSVVDTLNYHEGENETGVVHGPSITIRTNTYGVFHYSYFHVYVDGVLIGNYANTEAIQKAFSYHGSGDIEIVMSTW